MKKIVTNKLQVGLLPFFTQGVCWAHKGQPPVTKEKMDGIQRKIGEEFEPGFKSFVQDRCNRYPSWFFFSI